jgi:hypothetical protein
VIVPESLGNAEVRQPVDFVSQPFDVKDTSPAPRGAERGRSGLAAPR